MKIILSFTKALHKKFISWRRVEVLSAQLAYFIADRSAVLDIGCGDGKIANLIKQKNPSISIEGLEILPRPDCLIACKKFDGVSMPFQNFSIDVCVLVDVLHHVLTAKELLQEACRVSRKYILIKDHLCENRLDFLTLKAMDWIGNRPHGIPLVNKYLSEAQWKKYFSACGLRIVHWTSQIPIYPFPLNKIAGLNLHFIALLEKIPLN